MYTVLSLMDGNMPLGFHHFVPKYHSPTLKRSSLEQREIARLEKMAENGVTENGVSHLFLVSPPVVILVQCYTFQLFARPMCRDQMEYSFLLSVPEPPLHS